MAKISIDFSDVKAPSFSTVHQAPGVYNAEIAGVEMTKTKSDGTDMLVFAIVPRGCVACPGSCRPQAQR